MIRLISLLKRRDDVSADDFMAFWNGEELKAAVESVVALYKPVKWQTARALNIAVHDEVQEKLGRGEPFDAVLEYWWENAGDVLDIFRSEDGEAQTAAMQAVLAPYINQAESSTFFTEN